MYCRHVHTFQVLKMYNEPYCFQQALSKALQELRAEMASHAEQQLVTNITQKEENSNVQQIINKHTKELQVCSLTGHS